MDRITHTAEHVGGPWLALMATGACIAQLQAPVIV